MTETPSELVLHFLVGELGEALLRLARGKTLGASEDFAGVAV